MITLCMIARDEEAGLAECLEAARPAVDEIVLVDTGSRDKTREIAGRYGARVFPFPWRDDFSAPRNEALSRASGDWILVLDADEILEPGSAERIREGVRSREHCGFFLPMISLMDGGKRTQCLMVRLFVNRAEIRYRYLIHEQMLPDLTHHARRTGRGIGVLDAPVLHKGYLSETMRERGKESRNEALFRRQLRLFPRDVYSWYMYATFLRTSRRGGGTVLHAWRRAYDLLRGLPDERARAYPFAGEVAAFYGQALYEQEGDCLGAMEVLREGAARFTPTPNLFYLKGGLERTLGRPDEALRSYRRCIDLGKEAFTVALAEGVCDRLPLNGMGFSRLDLGDLEEARPCFVESIRLDPAQIDPYSGLAEIEVRLGRLDKALEWMDRLVRVRPDFAPAWKTGAELHQCLGRPDQAREWAARERELSLLSQAPSVV